MASLRQMLSHELETMFATLHTSTIQQQVEPRDSQFFIDEESEPINTERQFFDDPQVTDGTTTEKLWCLHGLRDHPGEGRISSSLR